eukprot:5162298-Karenia_brevis.AAC.1
MVSFPRCQQWVSIMLAVVRYIPYGVGPSRLPAALRDARRSISPLHTELSGFVYVLVWLEPNNGRSGSYSSGADHATQSFFLGKGVDLHTLYMGF